ncbi:MAG: hypothetical protein JWO94_2297 [Verrucomicrobiaceae bacterium]|nr:hypothetical protein [Verrucomicrobiaceae bacterium]
MESPAILPKPSAQRRPSARGRALMLLAFVALYGIACWLPALHLTGRRQVWSGMEVMVMGPMALRLGQFGWLANPAAIIALRSVMSGRTRLAIPCSVLAALLALHTPWLIGHQITLGPEPFNFVRVVSLGAGYYVWLAALLLPLAFALLLRRQRPGRRRLEAGSK